MENHTTHCEKVSFLGAKTENILQKVLKEPKTDHFNLSKVCDTIALIHVKTMRDYFGIDLILAEKTATGHHQLSYYWTPN